MTETSIDASLESTASPRLLPPNQFPRFYRGGARIGAFRGVAVEGDYVPEDWIGSTTTAYGEERLGLSPLDGGYLRDLIDADPETYLGPEHVARWGSDTRLLVKLLDPAERLPVHLHPDDETARRELHARCGKTEAWVFLEAPAGTVVRVGFEQPVSPEELADWYERQDVDAMLAAMRPLEVATGDILFVPAGLPHAIAADVFILELQQPSDFSLLLEWKDVPLGGADPLLGLDRDVALAAVRREPVTGEELAQLGSRRGSRLFPKAADAFFRAEQVTGDRELERGFAIVVAVAGEGSLETSSGGSVALAHGDAAVVPYAAGTFRLTGSLDALVCRPPAAA